MKSLGDYIHKKGLKFGIYSSAGNFTCEGRAGSLHYEEIDAQTWASWDVDYLKYDNCFNGNVPARIRYSAMRLTKIRLESKGSAWLAAIFRTCL